MKKEKSIVFDSAESFYLYQRTKTYQTTMMLLSHSCRTHTRDVANKIKGGLFFLNKIKNSTLNNTTDRQTNEGRDVFCCDGTNRYRIGPVNGDHVVSIQFNCIQTCLNIILSRSHCVNHFYSPMPLVHVQFRKFLN